MGRFLDLALLLFGFQAAGVFAQIDPVWPTKTFDLHAIPLLTILFIGGRRRGRGPLKDSCNRCHCRS